MPDASIERFVTWWSALPGVWLAGLAALGLGLFALTLLVAPWWVARLPADHFTREHATSGRGWGRFGVMVLRNALAMLALLIGLIMLVTPGPGVVMLVLALSLAEFPGKHPLIRRLAARPAVFSSLNWLRRQRNRPPFQHPALALATAVVCVMLMVPIAVAPAHAQDAIGSDDDELAEGGTPVAREPDPAVASDGVAAELDATAAELERLAAALADSRREREALAAKLAEAETAARERGTRVTGLDGDIARFAATLDELDAEVAAQQASIATRRATLAEGLRRLQRVEVPGALEVLLQHRDPAEAARVSVWAGQALRAQRRVLLAERDALGRIEAARERALKDRNWLEHLRGKARGQRDAQVALSASSREAVATVDSRITETSRTVATLEADAARLQTLLEQLRAEEAARSGYFENGKGEWPVPVAGRVDARYGDVKSVGNLAWNGLFIRADRGRPVAAVADGEVVYADWLTGFGLLVIVDHGDGWMTLYGGNDELLAPVGAWVESGATIATVGDSGGQTASGLYFEIRQDARPVDPEPWLTGIG